MNTSDIPFLIKTAACLNVNYPDIQKDTITYITISNDVLIFTISRLTICRKSVVKYKYQPFKSLENALFSAFYLSNDFIVGTFSDAIPKPLIFLSNSLLRFFQPDKKPCLPLKLITFRISSCII